MRFFQFEKSNGYVIHLLVNNTIYSCTRQLRCFVRADLLSKTAY